MSLHTGNHAVTPQLVVRTPRGGNKATALPHGTSLLDLRAAVPEEKDIEVKDGLRLFSLPSALIASSPGFFEHNPTDARAALATIRDASEVLDRLLERGHSKIAGRLAGAFRNIGRDRIADDIMNAMRAAGYSVANRTVRKPDRSGAPAARGVSLRWPHPSHVAADA